MANNRMQTRRASMVEALASNAAGYVLIAGIQWAVFPLFGIRVSASSSIWIAAVLTSALVLKSYVIRRWFEGRNDGR